MRVLIFFLLTLFMSFSKSEGSATFKTSLARNKGPQLVNKVKKEYKKKDGVILARMSWSGKRRMVRK